MSDLISRQGAIDGFYEMASNADYLCTVSDYVQFLETMTSAEPKKGKWEDKKVSTEKVIDEWQSARCSVCEKYHTTPYMYYFDNFNYCPNCGADMRGEHDETD